MPILNHKNVKNVSVLGEEKQLSVGTKFPFRKMCKESAHTIKLGLQQPKICYLEAELSSLRTLLIVLMGFEPQCPPLWHPFL